MSDQLVQIIAINIPNFIGFFIGLLLFHRAHSRAMDILEKVVDDCVDIKKSGALKKD